MKAPDQLDRPIAAISNSATSGIMTGGQALVASLALCGVKNIYGIPGETTTPFQQALQKSKSIRFVVGTHEGESAFAAYTNARITNKPSAISTTGSPGLNNARIAIESAYKASRPLIILAGQLDRKLLPYGKDASQYMDAEAHRNITKAILKPDSPQAVADAVANAYKLSQEGRPGPVLIELPSDLLQEKAPVSLKKPEIQQKQPNKQDIERTFDIIQQSPKLVILAGEMVNIEGAQEALKQFAMETGAAVITPMREQDAFPNSHPNYAGACGFVNPDHLESLCKELRETGGTLMVLGHRIAQETSNDYDPEWLKGVKLVHVYPDFNSLPKALRDLYVPNAAIESNIGPALAALSAKIEKEPIKVGEQQKAWLANLHQKQERFQNEPRTQTVGTMDREKVYSILKHKLPKETIITTGSGNHTSWPREMWVHDFPNTQVGPIDGAMGLGVPSAIGAALADKSRPTLAIVGDGDFSMSGINALKTAKKERLPLLILLDNNENFGNITHNQQQAGMDEAFQTDLGYVNYQKLVEGFGGKCWDLRNTDYFENTFDEALKHYQRGGIAVINMHTSVRDVLRGASPLTEKFTKNLPLRDKIGQFSHTDKLFIPSAKEGFLPGRDTDAQQFRKYINFRGGDPMAPPFKPMLKAASNSMKDNPLIRTYESQLIAGPTKSALAQYFQHIGIKGASAKNVMTGPGISALFSLTMKTMQHQKFLRKEDALLMPVPTYGIFPEAIRESGLDINMQPLALTPESGYKLTLEALDARITEMNEQLRYEFAEKHGYDVDDIRCKQAPRVKALLMTNPDNPLGNVYGYEEVKALADVIKKHDLWVVDDMAYKGLEYNKAKEATPMASIPGMEERTVTFLGLSKPFAGVQLRGGMVSAPETFIKGMTHFNYFRQGHGDTPIEAQHAIRSAYSLDPYIEQERKIYLKERSKEYEKRGYVLQGLLEGISTVPEHMRSVVTKELKSVAPSEKVSELLKGIPGAKVLTKPQSGFFHVVDMTPYKDIFDRQNPAFSAERNCITYMADKAKVLVLPGYSMSWPDKNQMVFRLSFALEPKEMVAGIERIKKGLELAIIQDKQIGIEGKAA